MVQEWSVGVDLTVWKWLGVSWEGPIEILRFVAHIGMGGQTRVEALNMKPGIDMVGWEK